MGQNNLLLGPNVGYNNVGSNNIFLGNEAAFKSVFGTDCIFIGEQAGYYNKASFGNIFIGKQSGKCSTKGHNNIFRKLYRAFSEREQRFVGQLRHLRARFR